ncbi:response regulator [Leptolyngbya sp. FACHB-261]|uniref:response regulator n=1 Tax=Leptolyngbya sp. FACHB-261 TaxID=2692806 RepID=UPI0018F020B2|nr:response regulator [Leptolyngbya sp. FACHB-261]
MGELTLEGAGSEASIKSQQAETAATVYRNDGNVISGSLVRGAKVTANVVAEAVTPRVIKQAGRTTILWVDDNPNNNIYERQSMEALGISFVLATSTEEALDRLNRQQFDAIISDMRRPPDPQAGYMLLEKLRSTGDHTPFIIYAGSRDSEHVAESRRRGAIGCINNPSALFEMLLSSLGRRV